MPTLAPSAAKSSAPSRRVCEGGELGEVRKEGVLVGYCDESSSYRVWDPIKGKVLNVGGAEFDEEVGSRWWRRKGEVGATLKKEEPDVNLPDLVPAADDVGNPFPPRIPLPPPPPPLPPAPDVTDPLAAYEEIPPVIVDDSDSEGDDGDVDTAPPSPRRSGRLNRGVPALRYDDIYEAAIDIMCPNMVKEALGGEQAEKWAAAMDNELEFH